MSFLFGAAMLFAAFVLISLCRKIMNRPVVARDPEAFGIAEAIAYVFTALTAIGAASITLAATNGRLPSVLIELAIIVAVLIGACLLVTLALGRVFPRDASQVFAADAPPTPPTIRAGRTAPGQRPGQAPGSRRRAA
jgi:hypothetical protein